MIGSASENRQFMEKPNFNDIIKKLGEYSQNLKENAQIGNSKLILAFAELIKVMGWSSDQSDTNNIQIANLTNEIKDLKTKLAAYSNSATAESKTMRYLTYALGLVAVLQLFIAYGQYMLGEVQVEVSRDQRGLDNAIWQYEMTRDDRIEKRDTEWRRLDLEYQGRLPIYDITSTP